jgi:hypothetical protein
MGIFDSLTPTGQRICVGAILAFTAGLAALFVTALLA